MSEGTRFVDVTVRGLKLATRAKCTEAGEGLFVEHEAPLPVGAQVMVTEDGGAARPALVVGVVEQEAGAKSAPGMKLAWADLVKIEPAPAAVAEEPVEETAEDVAAASPGEPAEGTPQNGRRKRKTRKTIIGRP